ncbi:MAG TPA: efflux RND transporter periplasmic adaptor subunit [Methylibium sp.]|uniref:efflux RND transporter periplasmic adaptor subunit n=1 Tax=Methylibium sp. TaxID=2067992 RepID=UPI002DB7DD45|nr:efflux RND transporter periplasmic adaptor subunit [Methylibium sp.]HEU4459544.1 efflux RND transporter periplasmic adaptor subunit [Methylibium sp.]
MKLRHTLITAAIVAALALASYAAYRAGMQRGMTAPASVQTASTAEDPTSSIAAGEAATRRHIQQGLKAGQVDPATGKSILYYHDPMVPGKRFDAPAKSPFMDMMLVPVYAGASEDAGTVTVSPRIQQNLGVRTAEVVEGTLQPKLAAVGSIAWNERDQSVLQARASGYVEKLHVRATLDRVKQGQPFVDFYVPDWIAAQEEYLAMRRIAPGDSALLAAARQRLLLVGMTEPQIARVEAAGRVQPRITLTSPSSGVVAELAVREGMTVSAGMTLARINGLGTVWALAEVPESQAALVRPGSTVEARSPADPGRVHRGTVQTLLPEVNATTRTVKARVQFDNPGGRLVPGAFVTMQFTDARAGKALLVPTEAVIQTGRRAVVMVAEENGRFRPVDVETGLETSGRIEIRRGLEAGQRVVVSSQFLIDSEASLRGVEARLNGDPKAATAKPAEVHRGQGVIEAIGRDAVTLSHGPIPSLKWAEMTMEFALPPPERLPRGLAAGDRVEFEFVMDPTDGPVVSRIVPLAPASGASR